MPQYRQNRAPAASKKSPISRTRLPRRTLPATLALCLWLMSKLPHLPDRFFSIFLPFLLCQTYPFQGGHLLTLPFSPADGIPLPGFTLLPFSFRLSSF